jgi:hypothetical protein
MIFKMPLSKGKITEDSAEMLMKWRHSGFIVFCGDRIQPGDEEAKENIARYTCHKRNIQLRYPPVEDPRFSRGR